MDEQFGILKKHGVTFRSMKLNLLTDNSGNYVKNQYGRCKKIFDWSTITRYKGVRLESYENKEYNSSLIMLGDVYNLIGIDVDNKDDTLLKFNEICKKNNYDITETTLTIKSMHNGYHYYFKLSDMQRNELKKLKAKNDALFGLHIDVMFNDQALIGPSLLGEYKYSNNN